MINEGLQKRYYTELLHRVKGQFGVDFRVSLYLYTDPDFNWRELDAIHLMTGFRNECKHFKKIGLHHFFLSY